MHPPRMGFPAPHLRRSVVRRLGFGVPTSVRQEVVTDVTPQRCLGVSWAVLAQK